MNCRRPFARLLALLCLIALLGTQAFGNARGYVCDCTGAVEWTALDHCEGPHGANCHRESATGGAHDEGAGQRKDHEQLRDDVQVRLLPAIQAPMHVPVLLAVFEVALLEVRPMNFAIGGAVADEDLGPPPGLTVARTIVLLV